MSLTDPILAAAQAATIAQVYDAHVPDKPALRYAVVYPDLGRLSSPALSGDLVASDIRFRFTYVAASRAEVEKLCGAIRSALLNTSFTDGEWSAEFDPDDHHATTPVARDEAVPDRTVFFATDEFKALATRR